MILRLLIFAVVGVCAFAFLKVGLKRAEQKRKPPESSVAADTTATYPTAKLTFMRDVVRSPYREGLFLDVHAVPPGRLARCEATGKPFFVPLARRPDLDFGRLAGQWRLEIHETPVKTYEVDFWFEGNIARARGKRVEVDGQALPPKAAGSTVSFHGLFQESQLRGLLTETPSAGGERFFYDCSWVFDSEWRRLDGDGRIDGRSVHVIATRPSSGAAIPSVARDLDGFVPSGCQRIALVEGAMPSNLGRFFAQVIEESAAPKRRWLVVARHRFGENHFADAITALAIRPGQENRAEDSFRGLFLAPAAGGKPRVGEFVIRHELGGLGKDHDGTEFVFRFESSDHQWRLIEGKSYRIDKDGKTHVQYHKAGVGLREFDLASPPETIPKP